MMEISDNSRHRAIKHKPMNDETKAKRPLPPRPATGLLAWQATLGYISTRHSPDAVLKLQAYSREARVYWSASVSWGGNHEDVRDHPSLAGALRALWDEVSRNHRIFDRAEDAVKSPIHYNDAEWLDLTTQEALQRLVWVTQSVFPGDWQLVLLYQPIDLPDSRMQARLLAKNNTIAVGARGSTLVDVCRNLFRNATPHFSGK